MPALLILALLLPAQAVCDAARQKGSEVQKDADLWALRHKQGCTLCAGGTSCREGFERADQVRRVMADWRKSHVCLVCAPGRCGAADLTLAAWTLEAGAKHKDKCRACGLDPIQCDAWRLVLEGLRNRLEDWRTEHPATCDKCAPACDEWKRKAQDFQLRADEVVRKHRERCNDCQRGLVACDRSSLLKNETQRERLMAWRRHVMECSCTRRTKRP